MHRESLARAIVLGLDLETNASRQLANRLTEHTGASLTVRNLRSPELLQWRADAFGEDSSWVPTLFEVSETRVQA